MSPPAGRRANARLRARHAGARALDAIARPGLIATGAALFGACSLIEQYPDPVPDPVSPTTTTSSTTSGGGNGGDSFTTTVTTGTGGTMTAGTGGTTTTTAGTSGSGGMGGSSGTGGSGGVGGSGGMGGSGCVVSSTEPCYTGPAVTRAVGACKDGVATCMPNGTFGSCLGEVLPTQELCATPEDEDCNGVSPPCPVGDVLWAQRFGDVANQAGSAVAADGLGNVVFAGTFSGTVNFGGVALASQGANDTYLVKLGAAGDHVWSKRFGNGGTEGTAGIAIDQDGDVSFVGRFNSGINFGQGPLTSAGQNDVFLAQFTPAGGVVWGQGYGDAANQLASDIAVGPGGKLLITGRVDGSIDFGLGPLVGAGGGDVFVAALSTAGTPLWAKVFGDNQLQIGTAVTFDGAGDLLVAGAFNGGIDLGSGLLTTANSNPLFLAKLDPTGAPLWSKAFDGQFSVLFTKSIFTDPQNNIFAYGRVNGTVDFGAGPEASFGPADNLFVVKLDPNGNHLWTKLFHGAPNGTVYDGGAVLDPFGNVVLTGSFDLDFSFGGASLVSAGSKDLFVVKLDGDGKHLWSRRFGDPMAQSGNGVAVDGMGNVFVVGDMSGSVDFGQGPLMSAGGSDVVVIKLSP